MRCSKNCFFTKRACPRGGILNGIETARIKHGEEAAAIRVAAFAPQQATLFHAPDLMGHAGAVPLQLISQRGDAQAAPLGFGQVDEHLVVGKRQSGIVPQLASLGRDGLGIQMNPQAPHALLFGVEPGAFLLNLDLAVRCGLLISHGTYYDITKKFYDQLFQC